MRITLRSPAEVEAAQEASAGLPDLLRQLDGVAVPCPPLSEDMDSSLADLGIVGGTIRLVRAGVDALDVAVDFWAPRRLSEKDIRALCDYVQGQMSDGVGESGFSVEAGPTPVRVNPSEG